MKMNKKTEALMKTLLTEEVAVIHAALEDKPRTVAFISMNKSMTVDEKLENCLLYTSPSPRDQRGSRMPSSA